MAEDRESWIAALESLTGKKRSDPVEKVEGVTDSQAPKKMTAGSMFKQMKRGASWKQGTQGPSTKQIIEKLSANDPSLTT
eukprot:UC4_evm1s949